MLFDCEIAQDNSTRADESGFADGDRMGVFVVNYRDGSPGTLTLSGNQANNVALTFDQDANRWNAATDLYWLDKTTPADIYGYYPFFNGLSSVTDYSFEVNADQGRPAADGDICSYEASDFLWAKAEKATPGQKVSLTYAHRMAGVKVVLQEGSGFADGQWAKVSKLVTVDNTTRHSSIDLQTGTVTATGDFDRNIVMNDDATGWRAVVVPQTVAAGKTTIGITIDGKPFAYTRDGGMKYTSGKMHTFTIKVDYNEGSGTYSLSLTSEDISEWESDNTSHDFVENAYVVVECPEAGKLRETLYSNHIDFNTIRNLKINGVLTTEDFYLMRDELISLSALNLKDVKIVNVKYFLEKSDGTNDEFFENDVMPEEALKGKSSLRRLILPEGLKIIGDVALGHLQLNSTLIIPESVTHILGSFWGVREGFSIIMPHHLEYIGSNSFYECKADIELVFTNTIKFIGWDAFWNASNAHGTLMIPNKLEHLGHGAFQGLGDRVSGEIVIPNTITEIPDYAFCGINIKGGTRVTLHDGITKIGNSAFSYITFAPGFKLPKNLKEIGDGTFSDCHFAEGLSLPESLQTIGKDTFGNSNIKGELVIPKSMEILSNASMTDCPWDLGTFGNTLLEKVTIGDNVEMIGGKAFYRNQYLRTVEIGKNVERIGYQAFGSCPGIQTIVCLANEPPRLYGDVFGGFDPLHCHLEVPEASVELYKRAEGWKDFHFISPHKELTVGIHKQTCLNKGMSRSVMLYSEGEWKLKSAPSWIHVSPDNGDYKSEITFTVDPSAKGSGDRTGIVVFELVGKDYTTEFEVTQYDFEHNEDTEIVLQKASASGKPINLFIVGDGFGAEEIVDGTYISHMSETMEQFFEIEPYKTYRPHFNVSTAVAMSLDNKIATLVNVNIDRLNTCGVVLDVPTVINYAISTSSAIDSGNVKDAMIVVVSNMDAFAGMSYPDESGCALACVSLSKEAYPYDQRGLVQHYAGGQSFAGLAVEYISHNEHIKGCTCPDCNSLSEYYDMKSKGLYENISLSGKIADAPWSEFIFNPAYSNVVDIWEGGFKHMLGVWRSEPQSVMGTFIPYYNTISRYSIYKAIMRRAGLSYSLEQFTANDKIELP